MQHFAEEGTEVSGIFRTRMKLDQVCAAIGPAAACKAVELSREAED